MKIRYWWILLTYVIMQFSNILGVPLLIKSGLYDGQGSSKEILSTAITHWTIGAFFVATIITLILLSKDLKETTPSRNRASVSEAIGWSIGGLFLAFFTQMIAGMIEVYVLGIQPGSENTQMIVQLSKVTPLFIIVVAILGPILEEIVFRYILFGALRKRLNFFFSALISSFIFAIVHQDFTHLLIYTSMGFVFAFLYVKTQRIIVPILAHTLMNGVVMLIQLSSEEIMKLQKQLDSIQSFIGGFL
jgi:uncharacterized protein